MSDWQVDGLGSRPLPPCGRVAWAIVSTLLECSFTEDKSLLPLEYCQEKPAPSRWYLRREFKD